MEKLGNYYLPIYSIWIVITHNMHTLTHIARADIIYYDNSVFLSKLGKMFEFHQPDKFYLYQ